MSSDLLKSNQTIASLSAPSIATTWLAKELEQELYSILHYWSTHTIDAVNGGFLGELDAGNQPVAEAPKGLVLNSRVLWAFSASARCYHNANWEAVATRAFEYIKNHFIDRTYGGAYWSLSATGQKLDGKKQTYGIAFCIYGLSEYAKLSGSEDALRLAIDLYHQLERHAWDQLYEGYLEAFTERWRPLADQRLSYKDQNTPKTTNTHLHVLEAYANLYELWPDRGLGDSINNLLHIFEDKIIDKDCYHLKLFFTQQWVSVENGYSLGHDIEAAWLLQQCGSVLSDPDSGTRFRQLAVQMSEVTVKWIEPDGALSYAVDCNQGRVNKEKHWWVEAEAMVGFNNAYQLTGEAAYYQLVLGLWDFIKRSLVDRTCGEWHWGIRVDGQPMNEPKAGFWKCPYHNVRACLEIIKREGTHLSKIKTDD